MEQINNSIALDIKQPQIETGLDALSKSVSISDVLSQMSQRKTQTAAASFALQEAKNRQAEQDAIESAIGNNTKLGDDGQITTDHEAVAAALPPKLQGRYRTEFAPKIDSELLQHNVDRNKIDLMRIQNEMALGSELRAGVAPQTGPGTPDPNDPTQTIPGPDRVSDAQREQVYQSVKARWAKIDPAAVKQMPDHYDSATVDPIVDSVMTRGQAQNDKAMTSLQIANARKEAAEAAQQAAKYDRETPEGARRYAARMAQISNWVDTTYPNMDQESRDSIKESAGMPKITRKAPSKPLLMNGADMPDDAVDDKGNPVPQAWRAAGARVALTRTSGKDFFTVTTPVKKTAQEEKDEKIENGYAVEVLHKPLDDLTLNPAEKIDAQVWRQKLTPEHETDLMRRIALLKSDPDLFTQLTGHQPAGTAKPLTIAERATTLNRVNAAVGREFPGAAATPEGQAYKASLLKDLSDHGVDLAAPAAKPAAAPAATPHAGKVTNKAAVQAQADKRKITYDQMKTIVESNGITIQ